MLQTRRLVPQLRALVFRKDFIFACIGVRSIDFKKCVAYPYMLLIRNHAVLRRIMHADNALQARILNFL